MMSRSGPAKLAAQLKLLPQGPGIESTGRLRQAQPSKPVAPARCWWDGEEGPIRDHWNCLGIPDLFVLDHNHIIQDVYITRFSTQKEFEEAIEPLVRKAPL